MKTLYALALVCLSVPAFANELDFDGLQQDNPAETGYSYDAGADLYFENENTATVIVPSEDYQLNLGLGRNNDPAYRDDALEGEETLADGWF